MNLRDPFRFRSATRATVKSAATSQPVRMLHVIALESQRSRLPQMAAALSYRTVFGLLPMIVVALVALRFFISDAQIDHFVNRALSYAGLEAIVVKPPPDAPPGDAPAASPAAAQPADAPQGEHHLVTPEEQSRNDLAETIRSLIDRAKSIDYRAVGLVGALTLIYAAITMLTEIERAFNQIFRVPVGKQWRRRILEYWALLTLGTPCLVATFFVGERAKSLVEHAVDSAGLSHSGAVGLIISSYAVTVLISAALLLLLYTILPNTRVRFVPALAGALVAAVVWEAGKWGFTQYLRYSTSYAKLYGSIALIPLFLLWIYATWVIVLFGLHITYHLQQARSGKGLAQPVDWSSPPSGVVDPSAAVAIAHAAARAFFAGKPVSLSSIVDTIHTQGAIVTDLVARLVDAGILYRVTVADDQNNVTLAQPPDRIRVRSVLEIGYELAGPLDAEGVTPGVRARMRDTHLRATGESTLADLLTSSTTPLPLAGANRHQPETLTPLPANRYPEPAPADTLPLQAEGDTDRAQEDPQNDARGSDPAPRPDRRPGML